MGNGIIAVVLLLVLEGKSGTGLEFITGSSTNVTILSDGNDRQWNGTTPGRS